MSLPTISIVTNCLDRRGGFPDHRRMPRDLLRQWRFDCKRFSDAGLREMGIALLRVLNGNEVEPYPISQSIAAPTREEMRRSHEELKARLDVVCEVLGKRWKIGRIGKAAASALKNNWATHFGSALEKIAKISKIKHPDEAGVAEARYYEARLYYKVVLDVLERKAS